MQGSAKHAKDYTKREKSRNRKERERELRNKGKKSLDVSPQALDQS